jgi:NodT family efflux transporter outer membrane factor (OMF) lipoprotein
VNRILKVTGFALLSALIVSGCVQLGPDYQEPAAVVETDWLEIDKQYFSTESAVGPRWWETTFNDPDLNWLVDSALQQNLTLRSAGLRVLQAQQQLAIAIGNQYPQQQAIAGDATRQKSGGITFNEYNLGFNLSWEADIWGRFSRQVESSAAQLDTSVASYDGALVSLVSQVAQNYILIRTFQRRIEVASANIEQQKESLRITRAKLDAGEVSELDADQAETLVYNSIATRIGFELSLQQLKNSLAVLLGEPPQSFRYLLDDKGEIPSVKANIALGMPQDIIRRRPDIRVAERQLAAQSAQIGVAITDLYPSFSIGGAIGSTSQDTKNLFNNDSDNDTRTWNLSAGFNWNIFNYGRLRSNVRLQDARFQQLLSDYRNTVLQAQGDVENAIVAYLKSHQQLDAYESAVKASQRAVDTATIQYQEGQIQFNTLLSTLTDNAQQQDVYASTQGSVNANLVQVYLSLGGGWEIRGKRNPVELLPAATRDEMKQRTDYWKGVLQ